MSHFTLIQDQYGPGSTWVRYYFALSCISFILIDICPIRPVDYPETARLPTQVVSGAGWIIVGDGAGFTSPLHSFGITAQMASSTYAAELMRTLDTPIGHVGGDQNWLEARGKTRP